MKVFVHRGLTLAAIIVAVLSTSASFSADWPTFRGLARTGVSPDTGLLTSWPAEGPKLVWQNKGAGRGYASLTIAGDRIYTLGDGPSTGDAKDEFLICFERSTGNPVWKTKTGAPWNEGPKDWQSSRSTPTVDGNLVYVVTPHGELVCCDAQSGAEAWRKNLKAEFKGNKGDGWGYSESPLIDGDLLICTPG
ncbi:MAG: PQQ-binding-like beta-propeller repeat protein, partial [Planctomycetes bacterium]|nr:PQQ-binding-like beta-propeller repeat protein [Planctomycetota bacterium]